MDANTLVLTSLERNAQAPEIDVEEFLVMAWHVEDFSFAAPTSRIGLVHASPQHRVPKHRLGSVTSGAQIYEANGIRLLPRLTVSKMGGPSFPTRRLLHSHPGLHPFQLGLVQGYEWKRCPLGSVKQIETVERSTACCDRAT